MKRRRKLLRWATNRYLWSIGIGLTWMLFFDQYDWISQYRLNRKIEQLEDEKVFYLQEIERIREEKQLLKNDPEALERLAREKYYMKKDNEDLFIIVSRESAQR